MPDFPIPEPQAGAGNRVLVLFSGGQDSTTLLAWARHHFEYVEAVSFDYGQRHSIELQQAQTIAGLLGVRLTHVPINSFVSLGSNELTDPDRSLTTAIDPQTDLPQTFVPGRNLIFLSLAAALAYSRGIRDLAGGMCEADYSGYPDCRREFIDSSERSISLALDARFRIHTPLMHLTKAQTWLLAQELGALDLVLEHSHTCYAGDRITRHAWGFGCGQCAACQLRAQGYHQAFAKS